MIGRLKSLFVSVLLLAGSFTAATAATVLDVPLYSDLNVGAVNALSDINVTGPISGTYDLFVRYGIWNGGGVQQVDITLTFDGSILSPTLESTSGYYTTLQSYSFDVSSLVQPGLNTLSVSGVDVSGVAQYAVGELAPAPTPLPAALPLFATGLGAMGLFGWRRKRKNAAAMVAA
jgi:hypothetical protein